MEEVKEELEPLFDYNRVQPPTFFYFDDNDLETSAIFAHCKRKKDGEVELATEEVVVLDGTEGGKNEKEDEDWMPPPPPKAFSVEALEDDKTLQELRLKKQELASFAQSAQDVLKDLVEISKREISCSKKPAEEVILDLPSDAQVEREKIVISIQDKGGHKQFRTYKDDKLDKLLKLYAKKVELCLEELVFTFDGDKVSPTATPEELGLEDGDIIEVHARLH